MSEQLQANGEQAVSTLVFFCFFLFLVTLDRRVLARVKRKLHWDESPTLLLTSVIGIKNRSILIWNWSRNALRYECSVTFHFHTRQTE